MQVIEEKFEVSPDYRVPLPGGDWRVWPWAVFRGAGFPVQEVLAFAAPESAAIADELLTAEQQFAQLHGQLADAVARLNLEVRNALAETAEETAEYQQLKEDLRAIRRAERQLQKGNVPDTAELPAVDAALAAAVQEQKARVEALTARFQETLEKEQVAVSEAIREFAGDDRFREAVTWQNRRARQTAVDPLRQTDPADRSSRNRQREELVASYGQRYCTKNDSIGFFGPVGWARVTDEPTTIEVEAGDDPVAERKIYFEEWGIHHLAETLAKIEDLRPWFIPRQIPYLYLKGTRLHLPGQETAALPFKQAAVFHACDGRRTAQEIAAELVENPLLEFADKEEVYRLLTLLSDARRIVWKPGIPTEGVYPERYLRWLLAQITDEPLRHKVISALDSLERAKESIAGVAGTVEPLDAALGELEQTFTTLTETAATRRAGEMYAARTLIYEDCRRNIDVNLGQLVLQELGHPLSLLLTSARWFTHKIGEMYRQTLKQAFDEAYAQLSHHSAARVLDFPTFWFWTQPLIMGDDDHVIETLLPTFQKHWADILALPPTSKPLTYSSEALRPLVEDLFAAPAPGWRTACYHNPDVMIAAESLAAINKGDYQLVLGELHMGINTLTAACFLLQHPSPETIFQIAQADFPTPRIVPMASREWTGQAARTQFIIMSPEDIRLVFSPETAVLPDAKSLPISRLVVEDTGEGLVVKTRDGSQVFDIIDVFSDFLMFKAANSFQMLASRRHSPRVTIDRLVVARESWLFTPEEMPFAFAGTTAEQFMAARQWLQSHQLPRFAFVKLPIETKPIYMDFASPIYLNTLARLIRQTADAEPANHTIKITEMLPQHNQTWLTDRQGNRYTSEFRILAVDPVSFRTSARHFTP